MWMPCGDSPISSGGQTGAQQRSPHCGLAAVAGRNCWQHHVVSRQGFRLRLLAKVGPLLRIIEQQLVITAG
jgi:hypothetical protein